MLHQTKWFGVSLMLHLAAITGLIAVAAHNAERPPETLMVMLDNFEMPDTPRYQAPIIPAQAELRPNPKAVSAAPAATSTIEIKPSLPQTVQPLVVPTKTTEYIQTREPQKTPLEQTPAAPRRPDLTAPAPAVTQATATSVQTLAEKAQQHYLKEHFAYIRDLITGQLVYPPMARKMNWSGKVLVAFTIAEDGSVHGLRVAESSGFPILDKSAMDTVRSVAPFPRPPVWADITVPIHFRMMR